MRRSPRWPGLGERLRMARQTAGLPQSQLARHLRVTQSTVSSYERGECRPGPERLAVYAALLGLDPQELARLAGYVRPDRREA